MKVLQLIDSLQAGGAERMAVNIVNGLLTHIEGSCLCVTRKEGLLKENLSNKVDYFFLKKKSAFDFKAIKRLHHYIKRNGIEIIHAHSTSFFLATIIKILNPKLILIWHDHYGNRERTSVINKLILKICSYFFTAIIVVNDSLRTWSKNNLLAKKVYVLVNCPIIDSRLKTTKLKGKLNKRIVCLANLRPDKDHINLLKAFNLVLKQKPDWSLHLVGQDFEDDYSRQIKRFIKENTLEAHVFVYGTCPDIHHILEQSTIGVLSSKSEGLPLSLLEYGLQKLPVIATDVGDCKIVISSSDEGLLIKPENSKDLATALLTYIKDSDMRNKAAKNLYTKISSNFSQKTVIEELVQIYNQERI